MKIFSIICSRLLISMTFSITFLDFLAFKHAECQLKRFKRPAAVIKTDYSKCMHGMNQTETEYPRHSKRSQTASLSQIGPLVLDIGITRYLLRMRKIAHVTS